MRNLMFVVILLASLLAVEAIAGLDPDPDGFGIYFDTYGMSRDIVIPMFVPFHAYLIVNNPSTAIDGFECTAWRVGGPHYELARSLGADAIDSDVTADGFRVVRSSPYPAQNGVVILVDWTLMTQAPAGVWLYVGAGTSPLLPGGLPVLANGGSYRLGTVVSESPDIPVACVNSGMSCVSADEPTSFGALKSLYR
jgi:hypothetical protein